MTAQGCYRGFRVSILQCFEDRSVIAVRLVAQLGSLLKGRSDVHHRSVLEIAND